MLTVDIDNNSGFCAGVIRAIGKAEEFLGKGERLYSLGAIVHNDAELSRLIGKGLVTIDKEDLEEMVEAGGETLLIRAHGEPPKTYETAERLGFQIIDCTCPVVLKLQQRIKEAYLKHVEDGKGQIIIFGKIGHAEVMGLMGQTEGTAIVVENADMLEDQGGIVVSVGDVDAMENALNTMRSREVREKMSAWALDKVKNTYTSDAVLKLLYKIYTGK